MTVRLESGTQEQPVPEDKRRAPVLDDEQAAELVRLGVQIEHLYGMPMDIEWTLAEGAVCHRPGAAHHGLARLPATAESAEPEAPIPTEWKLPDPKGGMRAGALSNSCPIR